MATREIDDRAAAVGSLSSAVSSPALKCAVGLHLSHHAVLYVQHATFITSRCSLSDSSRSESVSHAPSSIREGCHYSFQNAQESCRRIFLYWLGALIDRNRNRKNDLN